MKRKRGEFGEGKIGREKVQKNKKEEGKGRGEKNGGGKELSYCFWTKTNRTLPASVHFKQDLDPCSRFCTA